MSKYKNKKVEFNGITFDSLAECQRYQELMADPEVSQLLVHPRYLLVKGRKYKSSLGLQTIRPIHYEADFQFVRNGTCFIEDIKGMETPVFKLKLKLLVNVLPDGAVLRILKCRKAYRNGPYVYYDIF